MRLLAAVALLVASPALAQFGSFGGTGSKGRGGPSVAPLPTTFAWYGDSIAAGACSATTPTARLQSLLGAGWAGSTNAGDGTAPAVGGYTAAQIRTRYEATRDTACAGDRCGTYVFEGGVNSIVNGVSAAATLGDMKAIVDDCRSLGRNCVWYGILPFRGSAQGSDARTTAALSYNALMAAECATRPNVECLFPYAAFEDPANSGYLLPAYSCDGIHLVQDGTNALAALAAAALQ